MLSSSLSAGAAAAVPYTSTPVKATTLWELVRPMYAPLLTSGMSAATGAPSSQIA